MLWGPTSLLPLLTKQRNNSNVRENENTRIAVCQNTQLLGRHLAQLLPVRRTAPPSLFAATRTLICLTVSVNCVLHVCSCDDATLHRNFPIFFEFHEIPCSNFPTQLFLGLFPELFPSFPQSRTVLS